MATTIAQDSLKLDVGKFITLWLRAYQECSKEVQDLVNEMGEIINESDSRAEVEHAADVIVEALFPGHSQDVLGWHRKAMRSDDFVKAQEELDAQEAHFADKLRGLMQERNLTQEQLAERTGVSQPAISNILNRRCRPQQRTVSRFAEALDVDPSYLWTPLDN